MAARSYLPHLVLAIWPTIPAAAQAVYGSIAGTVVDTSGGSVAGASVTIESLERGTVDTVAANESGYFVKNRLLPGVTS